MLSVLIVNWNTRDLLRQCLESIFRYPPKDELQVIVVDNASTDGSAQMVRDAFSQAIVIEPGTNSGYARGNNLAMAAARGEWLLTLNPDTEVYDDTLQIAIDKLIENSSYGVLGAKQIGPTGEVQRSVRGFPTFWGVLGDLTGLGKLFKGTRLDSYRLRSFDYEKEQPAPQPMGTFLIFRRTALESLPSDSKNARNGGATRSSSWQESSLTPFDESFPIFFNEVDLLYRLQKAGWPCLYSPAVRIKHLGGESTKQVRKSMVWESHKSLMRFFEKHYRTPANAPLLLLLRGVVYLAALVRARGYDAGFKA